MATSFFGGSYFNGEFFSAGGVVVQPYQETPAGRPKRRAVRRKVFIEQGEEILLFDSPQDAYDYLQAEKLKAQVKSVKTGKKVKPPVRREEFKPIEFDVIEVPKLQEFADTQRIYVDVERLVKRNNFQRLIELMEMMRDEEDIEMLLLS